VKRSSRLAVHATELCEELRMDDNTAKMYGTMLHLDVVL
jgi:hypothetical protein